LNSARLPARRWPTCTTYSAPSGISSLMMHVVPGAQHRSVSAAELAAAVARHRLKPVVHSEPSRAVRLRRSLRSWGRLCPQEQRMPGPARLASVRMQPPQDGVPYNADAAVLASFLVFSHDPIVRPQGAGSPCLFSGARHLLPWPGVAAPLTAPACPVRTSSVPGPSGGARPRMPCPRPRSPWSCTTPRSAPPIARSSRRR
jgi:hypothetical protein